MTRSRIALPILLALALVGCHDLDLDLDGDGVAQRADCDDTDPTTYPGAPEVCDGRDNDCDEFVDDNVVTFRYQGSDGAFGLSVASGVTAVWFESLRQGEVTARGVDLYDGEGRRVLSELDGDADGHLDVTTGWEYDAAGRLERMGYGLEPGVFLYGQQFEYDALGRLTVASWWDTRDEPIPRSAVTYDYDEQGALTQRTHDVDDDGIPDRWEVYSYDAVGHRTETVGFDNAGTTYREVYSYDSNGYLLHTERDGDDDGVFEERLTTVHSSDGLLLSSTSEGNWERRYTYDSDGDLVIATLDPSNVAYTYAYDAADNLEVLRVADVQSTYHFTCESL